MCAFLPFASGICFPHPNSRFNKWSELHRINKPFQFLMMHLGAVWMTKVPVLLFASTGIHQRWMRKWKRHTENNRKVNRKAAAKRRKHIKHKKQKQELTSSQWNVCRGKFKYKFHFGSNVDVTHLGPIDLWNSLSIGWVKQFLVLSNRPYTSRHAFCPKLYRFPRECVASQQIQFLEQLMETPLFAGARKQHELHNPRISKACQ